MRPCSDSYYERHPNYEIGFVEYSERGNDFAPARTQRLIDQLKRLRPGGHRHGGVHSRLEAQRGTDDGNVASFNKALANLASSGVLGKRRLVGLYVGWRGKSMHGLYSENLTYWDRKAVAEEVGRGGVAELLAQLERIDRKDRNYLVIVGHSFGGAITLGALHDPLLERLLALQDGQRIRAFGDAVIMLNPAIEANQGLLLKENSLGRRPGNPAAAAAVRHQFARRQRHPLRLPARPMGRRQPHLEPGGPGQDLQRNPLSPPGRRPGYHRPRQLQPVSDRPADRPRVPAAGWQRQLRAKTARTTGDRRHRYRQMALQELLQRGRRQRRSGCRACPATATSRSTSSTPRSPSSPTTTISSTTR